MSTVGGVCDDLLRRMPLEDVRPVAAGRAAIMF